MRAFRGLPSRVYKMARNKLENKNAHSGDSTKNDCDISSNDEEPSFSDPEGFVDDISDEGKPRKLGWFGAGCHAVRLTFLASFTAFLGLNLLHFHLEVYHLVELGLKFVYGT